MRSSATIFASILVFSTSAAADPGNTAWESALYSGSQRLLLFSLLREQPVRSLPAAKKLVHDMGLAHARGEPLELLSRGLSAAPILEYDDNINGGIPGDVFYLGNFEFTIDEASRAKEGLVGGIALGASADFAFGDRNLLELNASAAYRYAPEFDLSKTAVSGSACASFYQGNWTWLEACARASAFENDLSRIEERAASVSGIKVFSSPVGVHEGRAGISYQFRDDYEKPTLELDLTTALPGVGAVSLGLDLSPKVEGENTTVFGASARLSRPVLGAYSALSMSYAHQSGSEFFGDVREDNVYGIQATRQIWGGVAANVGVTTRESTIDLHDDTSVFLSFTFAAWKF